MIKEIRLPEVSENVESGEIAKVLVKEGDFIEIDQPILELETDKAVVEVPSTFAGKITKVAVKAGENLKVGDLILQIDISSDEKSTSKTAVTKIDDEVESLTKKAIAKVEEESVASVAEEDTRNESNVTPDSVKPTIPSSPSYIEASPIKPIPASPSVRKMAREMGVNINQVRGSGEYGRITVEDLKAHIKLVMSSPTSSSSGALPPKQLPDFGNWGYIEREPMSKIRRITAENLSYAWNAIPHVFQFDKADITDLEAFRKRYSPQVEKVGAKLTLTAILVRILAEGLKIFPQFNASVDMVNNEIIYKKYYNIGVAVDTKRGLLVPVIKNADTKSITQIAIELNELAEKSRSGKIQPADMEGGTFTISNLGGISGTGFTPIVYWPQVSILGVDRASIEPVFKDGTFVPRLITPLTVSYDHRIIDGADAARFSKWIVEALESPMSMWLAG